MAAIDFPSTPSNGDTFLANGIYYVYDDTKGIWKVFETGSNFTLNDAQTLDGQAPSYYLNYANFTNKPSLDTANIAETTSLYYTEDRANAAIDNRVDKAFVDELNVNALALGGFLSSSYVKVDQLTTANVGEINNLYFTEARVNTVIESKVNKAYIDDIGVDAATLNGISSSIFDTLATTAYVQEVAQGLSTKPSVKAATSTNITATYNNGNAGVGGNLIIAAAASFEVDGVSSWELFDGILVKDQSNSFENGRYYVSQIGNVFANWILTRCGYCDEASEIPGSYIFVFDGNVNINTGWVGTVDDPLTFTVGTDDVIYRQFSGAGTYQAGNNLSLSGTVFNVVGGSGSNLDADLLDGKQGTFYSNNFMVVALSDESTAIEVGQKLSMRAPFALTLYQTPRASLNVASTSGIVRVDIKNSGNSIFSSNIEIDQDEKTSVTAANSASLTTTSISDDEEITMEVIEAGTGASGLKVTLYYRKT